jgi:hypothetical protein
MHLYFGTSYDRVHHLVTGNHPINEYQVKSPQPQRVRMISSITWLGPPFPRVNLSLIYINILANPDMLFKLQKAKAGVHQQDRQVRFCES